MSEGAPGKNSSGENALSKRAFGQNHLGRGLANRRTTLTATDPRSHPDRHIGRTATDSAGLRISHENPVVTAKHHITGHINGHASSAPHRGTPRESQPHEPRTHRNAVSRADSHRMGCAYSPTRAGTNPSTTNRISKIWKKLANAPTSLRDAPPPGSLLAAIDIAAIDIKNLNRQASVTGATRPPPSSGKSGEPPLVLLASDPAMSSRAAGTTTRRNHDS
ncbi:MAG: hypothetical protein NTT76_02880 [Achromobacter xylosoxidans]|nr:hypothetical protein [Achromobacter xylosoxidans]